MIGFYLCLQAVFTTTVVVHLSLVSLWRMGPLICPLQAMLSIALSWIQDVHSPCWSFLAMWRLSNGCPLWHLPSGAYVSDILRFWSEDILKTWPSHFHLLALTCSLTMDCGSGQHKLSCWVSYEHRLAATCLLWSKKIGCLNDIITLNFAN